jgi:hypothetical protein
MHEKTAWASDIHGKRKRWLGKHCRSLKRKKKKRVQEVTNT